MANKVIGYFADNNQAHWALRELKSKGFREISILGNERGEDPGSRDISQSTSSWPSLDMSGETLGGLAGLALGAGAMVIPGIGPILALGPLAMTVGGAVSGGITDALVDYGIPEETSRFFEAKVREGNTVMVLKTDDHLTDEAARVMRNFGAQDVTIH
ncbi:MAG: hypothetical protein ABRQ24_00700 [Syntrophomonadaceae bacterium]